MKKIFGLLLFILLILIPTINSINVQVDGEISEYSNVYNEKVIITLKCNEDLILNIPSNAYDVYFLNQTYLNSSIYFSNCNEANILEYKMNIVEKVNKDLFRIERNFNNMNNINYSYNIKVPLSYQLNHNNSIPKKFEIAEEGTKKNFAFKPNEIFVLYFKNVDLEDNSLTYLHTIEELSETTVIFIMIFFFLIGCLTMYFFMKRKIKKIPNSSVPSYVLSSDEKLIFDVIKTDPGINQKQIGKKVNYSKAKVSNLISELEQKQLIRREKFGRSFKVFVKKKLI